MKAFPWKKGLSRTQMVFVPHGMFSWYICTHFSLNGHLFLSMPSPQISNSPLHTQTLMQSLSWNSWVSIFSSVESSAFNSSPRIGSLKKWSVACCFFLFQKIIWMLYIFLMWFVPAILKLSWKSRLSDDLPSDRPCCMIKLELSEPGSE